MIAAQGGPADFVDRWPDRLPAAPVMIDFLSPLDGFVTAIDTLALGHVVVHLGGGRLREGDRINPSVGLSDLAGLNEPVEPGQPLARVHAATVAQAEAALKPLAAAYTIGERAVEEPPLILGKIT
jgi:thymidine phosphorylase